MTKKYSKCTFQAIHSGTEIKEQNPKFEMVFFLKKLCKVIAVKKL